MKSCQKSIKTFELRLSKNIKLNSLPVYDDRYIKSKIKTYVDNAFTNFRALNVLEDDKEREFFPVIYIDSLLVYVNKYYVQVYLDNCAYKNVDKWMIDYLGENLLETDVN